MENTSTIEFDLNLFSKEELINFIIFANTRNITFNEAINRMLQNFLDQYEKE